MLAKLKNLLEKYGAASTIRLLGRYAASAALARLGPGKEERETCDALLRQLRAGEYERVILRSGSFGWHTPLVQRAQQLARALSESGCLVLYEATPPHERVRGAVRLGERLWLVNLRAKGFAAAIERETAAGGRPRWLLVASPESRLAVKTVRRLADRGWTVLYDYIDAIDPAIGGGKRVPRKTAALYRYAMENKDCRVIASSLALLREAESKKGKEGSVLVENGVEFARFSSPGPLPEDDAFRALLQKGKPIVCFYGALAEWLDYAALRTIAADGRFSLLLIGAKYDGSYDRELGERENVCFLGTRPYETLRDYAARCDVLLIPFQKGRVGDAASPVKLFEYFALQKPVVAGDTAECRRYPCVLIARSAQDYPRVIERALTLGHDPALLAAEEKEARAADWRRRAEKLTASLRTWENGAAEKKDGRP